MFRVERGDPTDAELAALVAVVGVLSRPSQAEAERPSSAWARRDRLVRQPLVPGPGAWRASAWPR